MKYRSITIWLLALVSLIFMAASQALAQDDNSDGKYQVLLRLGRGSIYDVAISPEGKRLAVGSATGIWLYTVPELEDIAWFETDAATNIDWSSDGERIASIDSDGPVRVWEVATGEVLRALKGHDQIYLNSHFKTNVVWSPDGKQLVSVGSEGTMRVWDVATGEELVALEGQINFRSIVLAWSPDGERFAASAYKTVRVWETANWEQLAELVGHTTHVSKVVWSPDGARIASMSNLIHSSERGTEFGQLRVWDTSSGEMLLLLDGNISSSVSVVWSPDGQRIASLYGDDKVRVWDANMGDVLSLLMGKSHATETIEWLSSEKWDLTARIWGNWPNDVNSVLRIQKGHGGGALGNIMWSPDGRRISVLEFNLHIFRVWDAESGAVLLTVESSDSDIPLTSIPAAWSPDGRHLAFGDDRTLWVWDAAGASGVMRTVLDEYPSSITSIDWSTDGEYIVLGGGDGTVGVIYAVGGLVRAPLELYTPGVVEVTWSPDGQRLATYGSGTVHVLDAVSGRELAQLDLTAGAWFGSVKWSPDGQRLAILIVDDVEEWEGSLWLWESITIGPKQIDTELSFAIPWSVVWSPDGRRLAWISSYQSIGIMDVASGEFTFSPFRGRWDSLAWSPDGQRIATTDQLEGVVQVWDAITWEELDILGHHLALEVAWSPDGQRIATSGHSWDGTLKIWGRQVKPTNDR